MAEPRISSSMFTDSLLRDHPVVVRTFHFSLDPSAYLIPGVPGSPQQFTDQAQKQVLATFRQFLFDDYPVNVKCKLVPGTAAKRTASLLLEVTGPASWFEKVAQAVAEIDAHNIRQSIERERRVAMFLENEYADCERDKREYPAFVPISSSTGTVFAAQPGGTALLANHSMPPGLGG